MTPPIRLTESQLHAYVDGLLPDDERAHIEALIAADAEAQAMVAAYRAQNLALHALHDGTMSEPRPAAMDAALRRRRGRLLTVLRRSVAALVLIALGGVGGWTLRGTLAPPVQASFTDTFVRYAAYAHLVYLPEVRHPVEVAANEEAHLVAWLSKRLGQPLQAPNLTSVGFNLVGGRLLPSGHGPAAQFMYENDTGQRLTIYVRASEANAPSETAFRFVHHEGVSLFYWMDQALAYAVIGQVDRERLLQVARAAYQTVNP